MQIHLAAIYPSDSPEDNIRRFIARNRTIYDVESECQRGAVFGSEEGLWPKYERFAVIAGRNERGRLRWAEGLQAEPEQARRLERLLEGGLELWMRRSNAQLLSKELTKTLFLTYGDHL